jgi:hypothetical protein
MPFPVVGASASGEAPSHPAYVRAKEYSTQALSLLTALTEREGVIPGWRQIGQATSLLTGEQVDWLERFYVLRRREEVVDFLSDHPFLLALLQDAQGQIETHFRSYSQLILEVVTDPEALDDRELVLFIQTELGPEEALASLDRLDENWWFDASRVSRGMLCIDVE